MAVEGTITHKPWVRQVAALVLVGLGMFLLKLCVFDVLAAANRHEAISVRLNGVLLAPLLVFGGLLATAASFSSRGKGWVERLMSNPETKRLSRTGWAIVLAAIAVGGGVYFWLVSHLAALGYDV